MYGGVDPRFIFFTIRVFDYPGVMGTFPRKGKNSSTKRVETIDLIKPLIQEIVKQFYLILLDLFRSEVTGHKVVILLLHIPLG